MELNQANVDRVVETFIGHFQRLPKSGKPAVDEWTVGAGIIEISGGDFRIVSFGTGSKCVGKNRLTRNGDVVHDGHAEVVARRAFLIYLMKELENLTVFNKSRVFSKSDTGRFLINANLRYWIVTSVVPCGDASIMPMTDNESHDTGKKRKGVDVEEPMKKLIRLADIHRTGAKCLPNAEIQDEKLTGTKFHVTGQIRTKPGRGDPTASVSCSDKLARWNAVGLQGALLSILIDQPIFLEAVIITGATSYSVDSLERAINARIGQPNKVSFFQSTLTFPASRSSARQKPSPCSISWNVATQSADVCVDGHRLGATKTRPGALLAITKKNIFQTFLKLISIISELPEQLQNVNPTELTYEQFKNLSKNYKKSWKSLKNDVFGHWTEKPDFVDNFRLN